MIKLGQAKVSLEQREIYKDGVASRVGTRAFDILEMLIRSRGQLVTKDDILHHVWPETVVEENNLQVHISALRKALGCDRDMIRTVPGRGYRLVQPENATYLEKQDSSLPASTLVHTVSTNNLLTRNVQLIGRDLLQVEVCDALRESPLVTLVGTGGIGKTVLARAVGHQLMTREAMEVFFVPLEELKCSELVIEAFACALNIDCSACESILDTIVAQLGERQVLIVLDNCEHVIEVAASLCEHIIRHCAAVKILATSREPLRISVERMMSVPPLDTPEAGADSTQILQSSSARLFLERVGAFDSSFSRDEQSIEFVGWVCRKLDGIPLALEMGATRASTLGLCELAAELEDGLHLLAAGLRTAPKRHQTLEASLEWSYQLLSAGERIVLRHLGTLSGRFTLDLACKVTAGTGLSRERVMDCVVGLASKSLLMIIAQGPLRFYRLLDATRTYALEKLRDSPGHSSVEPEKTGRLENSLRFEDGATLEKLRSRATLPEPSRFHANHQRVLAARQ